MAISAMSRAEIEALTLEGSTVTDTVEPTLANGEPFGTLVAGKAHRFNLVVRARGAGERKIEVLDVQPPELRASLVPMPTEGSYRLTLEVPEDCPMVVFNTHQKHGYVHVGDPRDKDNFSNWFPVNGAVVELAP